MLPTVLKLLNINKQLSDYFSLKDITFELKEGEVHILMGENGSGKSSLVNIIGGSYIKDSGEIFINGKIVSINSPMDAKDLGISIIHQDSKLFDHFTVAENIYIDNKPYLNRSVKLINWSKLYSDCSKLLGKFGFNINPKNTVKNLNIAEKQLVEICKAYVSNSKIIIMDEPTASLTEAESLVLFRIIEDLKKSGVAILYITHKLYDVTKIGDKITILKNGKIIRTSSLANMNSHSIINMMTGTKTKEPYPKLNIKTGNEVLKVENLTAGSILKNINFSLKKGEILGIIGLVGSGRTKIARCLFGLDPITTGKVNVNGKHLQTNSPKVAISNGIGYLTEDRNSDGLFMYLDIAQNMTAPNISRISDKLIIHKDIEDELAKTYIDRLGIKIGTINNTPAYLSGGNQQKVILSKWIMSKCKILILDEPTKGIDISSKVDVYNLMNEMVMKNVSLILISSDVDEVLGMCDRILVLYNGEISAIIPRNKATRENILYYATGGKN